MDIHKTVVSYEIYCDYCKQKQEEESGPCKSCGATSKQKRMIYRIVKTDERRVYPI